MDNYQKMEQFLKSAEQEEKGSVIYMKQIQMVELPEKNIVMMEKK